VGTDLSAADLTAAHDAVVLAGGATAPRGFPPDFPGAQLKGIHQAMEYLPLANRVQEGDMDSSPIDATGKDVIIVGGGDTGADCLGTATRQGARSIKQLEIMPRPPEGRSEGNPWPSWPLIYRTSSAHEEGGDRLFAVETVEFIGDDDGNLTGLRVVDVEMNTTGQGSPFVRIDGTERVLPADLVFMAMGFVGPEKGSLLDELGVSLDARGAVARDGNYATDAADVFVCGDMGRGQSLIVWAIAEGRACAAAVDEALMGSTTLPRPVAPTDRPL
jgi:glutamate synthase (NADPH/NADH) small chain